MAGAWYTVRRLCSGAAGTTDGLLHGYNLGALQELVIVCIYEELVTQEFAPPPSRSYQSARRVSM